MLENRRGNKQMDNQETMATPGTQDEDKQSTTRKTKKMNNMDLTKTRGEPR
jgi:hypothetical protein